MKRFCLFLLLLLTLSVLGACVKPTTDNLAKFEDTVLAEDVIANAVFKIKPRMAWNEANALLGNHYFLVSGESGVNVPSGEFYGDILCYTLSNFQKLYVKISRPSIPELSYQDPIDSYVNLFSVESISLDDVVLETDENGFYTIKPENVTATPSVIPHSSATSSDIAQLSTSSDFASIKKIFGEQFDSITSSGKAVTQVAYHLADNSLLEIALSLTTYRKPTEAGMTIVVQTYWADSVTLDGVALQTDEAGNFLLPDA